MISKGWNYIKRKGPAVLFLKILEKLSNFPKQVIYFSILNRKLKIAQQNPIDISIEQAKEYLKLKLTGKNAGEFIYSPNGRKPLLYASAYAALLFSLTNELENISPSDKDSWIKYIQSYQDKNDGLFKDISIDNTIATTEDWWGWRHLSVHAASALIALGGLPNYRFKFLNALYEPGEIVRWLDRFDWNNKPDYASNAILNIGSLMQFDRDYFYENKVENCLKNLYQYFDSKVDPLTGLWGIKKPKSKTHLSMNIQTSYHIWLLYFYDKHSIPYIEEAIESLLESQNTLGGFGPYSNSSACEDIDAIDPLVRFWFLVPEKRKQIEESLLKASKWVRINQMGDGGFVFRRFESFHYGHNLMSTRPEEPNAFATWFRALSLAYLSKVIDSAKEKDQWHWIQCPGYQFWHEG